MECVRIRCVEEGFEAALRPPPSRQLHPRKLDGFQEAHLLALVCSPAPKGRKRWSLRLLADKFVELEVVDDIYHMEDVLDVYMRPYDLRRPVVCLDETSVQLVAETRRCNQRGPMSRPMHKRPTARSGWRRRQRAGR